MASLTKVIVVHLVPATAVVFACPLGGPPDCPPLLCWQWVPIQISSQLRESFHTFLFCLPLYYKSRSFNVLKKNCLPTNV